MEFWRNRVSRSPRANPSPVAREVLRHLEAQPEAPGWPGDVEIVTIPYDSAIRPRSFARDRSIYPVAEIPVDELVASQRTVDRSQVADLLTQAFDEPILVEPYHGRVPGGRYAIQDGHHRAYAASLRGDRTIRARVARG